MVASHQFTDDELINSDNAMNLISSKPPLPRGLTTPKKRRRASSLKYNSSRSAAGYSDIDNNNDDDDNDEIYDVDDDTGAPSSTISAPR